MATVLEPATRTFDVTINAGIADKIDETAAAMHRPRAEIVEEALADWLDTEDWKHRGTLEAMADARAGRTIDNERAVAWIDSLSTDNPLPIPEP